MVVKWVWAGIFKELISPKKALLEAILALFLQTKGIFEDQFFLIRGEFIITALLLVL